MQLGKNSWQRLKTLDYCLQAYCGYQIRHTSQQEKHKFNVAAASEVKAAPRKTKSFCSDPDEINEGFEIVRKAFEDDFGCTEDDPLAALKWMTTATNCSGPLEGWPSGLLEKMIHTLQVGGANAKILRKHPLAFAAYVPWLLEIYQEIYQHQDSATLGLFWRCQYWLAAPTTRI